MAAVGAGGGGGRRPADGGGRRRLRGRSRLAEIVQPALEAFDPLQQRGWVVVGFRVREPDERDLERDPCIQGVPHRDHGGPQHLHRADGSSGSDQEDQPTLGRCLARHRRRGLAVPGHPGRDRGEELAAQLVEELGGDARRVPPGDVCALDRLQGTSRVSLRQ